MREKTIFLDLLTQNSHKTVHNLSIAMCCSLRAFVGVWWWGFVLVIASPMHTYAVLSQGHEWATKEK